MFYIEYSFNSVTFLFLFTCENPLCKCLRNVLSEKMSGGDGE
jgi:hypothetical protein